MRSVASGATCVSDSWRDVDFAVNIHSGRTCLTLRAWNAALVIELDGGHHCTSLDAERDAWIRAGGFTILRFWNNEVLNRIQDVLADIPGALGSSGPHPNLPPQAGEGA